ncbi:hypothetical protein EPI10_029110 [Gossypium australe]|uniref:Uncharacterized protein n=1 Tax=Gossypium australe TaxID=47621 RepID=A0A5B6V0R5_9ROSI|nr:hypothetical protein EPI10_029110 [Gossypium australe]
MAKKKENQNFCMFEESREQHNENEEDASILEDSNTKKVRFKESDAIPEEVMFVDPPPVPSLSWNDMLVGKEIFYQINKSDGQYFADNFSLTEQDVKKSFIDGVPSIDFSERVYQLLEKGNANLCGTQDVGTKPWNHDFAE